MSNQRRSSDVGVGFLALLETIADWATTIGLAGAGLMLAVMAYQVFGGSIFNPDNPQQAATVVANLAQIWLICSLVVAVLWAVRRTDQSEEQAGYILLYGITAWFGIPYLIRAVGQGKGMNWDNEAVRTWMETSRQIGIWSLVTLAWPAIRLGYMRVRSQVERRASRAYKDQAKLRRETRTARTHVFSPCWKLPYCRDYLLAVCPAYKARKRCWKLKRGCFCDPTMIESLTSGVPGAASGQAAYLRAELDARNTILAQRAKRPPCKRCFNYLEHQELKYQALNPIVYPAVAAAAYFAYKPVVWPAWQWFQQAVGNIWAKIALTDAPVDVAVTDVQGQTVVAIMITVLLGMGLLLLALRLVEVWCFRWKL